MENNLQQNQILVPVTNIEETFEFIRKRLSFDIENELRHVDKELFKKEHRRFEMSGYDVTPGQCTLHNLSILNLFADLGIYDYTDYLFLDFYKGTPTLYMRYVSSEENLEFEMNGLGTVEIIYEIFQKTIFSNKPQRRRK